MIIDCKSPTWNPATERYHVFVDGIEIQQVWYLDTDLGLVKSYDLGDGIPITAAVQLTPGLRARGEREGWEIPPDGVASRVIRGAVTLTPRAD